MEMENMARKYYIDWDRVYLESKNGTLCQYIQNIPQSHWRDTDNIDGLSLLHFACYGNNIDAIIMLVSKHGLDVNIEDAYNRNPIKVAMISMINCLGQFNFKILQVLCALGAKPSMVSRNETNAFDLSLMYHRGRDAGIIFVSNGERVKTFKSAYVEKCVTRISIVENGVIQCRDIIVTLLGLKKRRNHYQNNGCSLILPRLDRFLIKEVLAVEIWTTRVEEKWHNK